MATLLTLTAPCPARAADRESTRIAEYLHTLPVAKAMQQSDAEIGTLAALPLSCIDHPEERYENPSDYLWIHDSNMRTVDQYWKHRAFYGCLDWHSAVNSTWLMVALLKQAPSLSLAPVIRQRLAEHLGKDNIAGEIAFFSEPTDSEGKNFERPYGYAWLLKLYGELASWKDPDAATLTANLDPLVKLLSAKYVSYLHSLPYPMRVGVHPNTALTMGFVEDYLDHVPDPLLQKEIRDTALRFFQNDKNCPTAYEPANGDFLSPCLTEAMLMSRVLDAKSYVAWLDQFLPPVYSREFQVYAAEIDVSRIQASGSKADSSDSEGLLGSKSHLIGLAFQRAAALLRIASALPADDPRVPVFQRLAALNAQRGFEKMGDAGYMGQHWLATYAMLYMQAAAAN